MSINPYLGLDDFAFDKDKVYGWKPEKSKCTCGAEKAGYSLIINPESHSTWCDGLIDDIIVDLQEEII